MMRRRAKQEASEEILTLSFIDTLCCCLGATVLLFVALVSNSQNQGGAVQRIRGEFLRITYTAGDPDAILHFIIQPPSGRQIELSPAEMNGTGYFRESTPYWRALRVVGFSAATRPLAAGVAHRYEILVFDPAVGKWQFSARYTDRRDVELLLGRAPLVDVERRASASFPIRTRLVSQKLAFSEATCSGTPCDTLEVPPDPSLLAAK